MPKQGRGWAIYLLSVVAVGALSLLSVVPFPVLTSTGSFLGGLYYYLDRKRKQVGLDNLRLALGSEKSERELREILKTVYRNMGSSLLEFAALPKLNQKEIRDLVRWEGLEKIETARETGRGIIFLSAHFGNWELLAQAFAIHGYPSYGIGRRANVPLLHNFIIRCRESHGNRVIVRDQAMRKVLTILKEGKMLGVLGDQRGSTSRGLAINFFGHPAPTDPALPRLILKTQATVLPIFMVRDSDGRHTIHIQDPMEISRTESLEADVFRVAREYMSIIEGFVRQYPEQWLWMHRRWMTRGGKT